ncbi:hypothetical protein C8R45DRAFT_938644 [Mycena sanguinolenta]|nr:hypothetical protein C8R45DRAFT_938644 [Mycena sanguinolenta]
MYLEKGRHALESVWLSSATAATPCQSSPECRAVDQIGREYSGYPDQRVSLMHEKQQEDTNSYRDVQEYSDRRTTRQCPQGVLEERRLYALEEKACTLKGLRANADEAMRGMGTGDEGENEDETYEER